LQRSALALALLSVFTLPSTARAQTSVYGTISLTNYGFSSTAQDTLNYSPNANNFSFNSDNLGLGAGATYLIPSSHRFKAGLDLRETYSIGHGGGNSGFASLRLAFVPHRNPLSPYFQLGGGYIHSPLPGGEYVITVQPGDNTQVIHQSGVTGGAIDIALGLNVRASEHWTIRAIELGSTAGPRVASASLGTGVIYTLPSRTRQNP
jgi:hypothetical protein